MKLLQMAAIVKPLTWEFVNFTTEKTGTTVTTGKLLTNLQVTISPSILGKRFSNPQKNIVTALVPRE